MDEETVDALTTAIAERMGVTRGCLADAAKRNVDRDISLEMVSRL
jgi:hypothetical protein